MLRKLRIAWAFYGMRDWPDERFIIGWRRAWQIAEIIRIAILEKEIAARNTETATSEKE